MAFTVSVTPVTHHPSQLLLFGHSFLRSASNSNSKSNSKHQSKQRIRKWSCVASNSSLQGLASVPGPVKQEEVVNGLWAWLEQAGVVSGKQSGAVRAASVGYEGLGLVAQRAVRKGEEVLQVPKTSWMSLEVAKESSIGRFLGSQRPWVALALFLIAEKANSLSSWRPYLESLPDSLDSTLFWSDEELLELQGSQLLASTLSFREYVQNEFERVQLEILSPNANVFDANTFTLEAFLWAFGTLRSRTFPPLTGDNLALVPLADLMNHGSVITVERSSWELRKGTGLFGSQDCLVVRALNSVGAGEQIVMDYGASKGNGQLALEYGFVDQSVGPSFAPRSTARDTFTLTLELPESGSFFDDKVDIAEINGLGTSVSFDLVSGRGPPEQMLTFLRLMVLDGPDAFLLEALFRDAVWGHLALPVSKENEEDMCTAILTGCKAALAGYPTTNDEDVQLLESGIDNPRLEMAALVRLGEKRVLEELQAWFESHLAQVDKLEFYAERRLRDLGLLDDKGFMTPWVFGE